MAFLTKAQARAASPYRGRIHLAEAALRAASSVSTTARFDVFLSHSRLDAELILGVKSLLEDQGQSVYVDWIDDPHLSRNSVTPQTADVLRQRMRHSECLVFATSEASPSSKWMPWELGYFDGFKPDRVAVLPLVETPGEGFHGQEYLGLYPYLEDVSGLSARKKLGIRVAGGQALGIGSFIASGAYRS